MKKIYNLIVLMVFGMAVKSQTPVSSAFPQGFGSDPVSVPTLSNITGWSASDYSELVLDDTQPSGSTSGSNVVVYVNSNSSTYTVTFNSVTTNGFTGINISWEQYNSTTSSVSVTVQWSSNGTSWNNFSYNQPVSSGVWTSCSSLSNLPSSAEGVPNFSLRFVFSGNGAFDPTLIDDVSITGNATPIYYYNGGAIEALSSWEYFGIPGMNPANFTDNNIAYYLADYTNFTTSGVLTGNWTVDGSGTKLYIGDGAGVDYNLDIPAAFALTLGASSPAMTVLNNSTLTLHNTNFPTTNVTYTTGSTVEFAQTSSININPQSYSNMIISGTNITHNSGSLSITGNLNLVTNLTMNNAAAGSSLVLNGTVSGSGLLMTRSNSRLVIGGTGSLGTLNFGNGGSNKTLNALQINRTSSGNIDLGTDLTVSGSTLFNNGNLNINGKKLILNGAITFSNTSTLGGSTSSSLTISGSGVINNSLRMNQTSASTKALDEFVLNRTGRTVTLGNSMEIWGNITPTLGTIASGSGNLTLKSDATHKARLGPLDASNGFFTGNPTVEVYRPALNTDWINLCSAGVTGNTFAGWASAFPMTCSTCPLGNGATGLPGSVYSYNEALAAGSSSNSAAYVDIDSFGGYTSTIDSRKGYYVFIGTSSLGGVSSAITIPLTGSVNTKNSSGNITITKTGSDPTEDGWNLIANPYPSALTASAVIATMGANINAASLQSYNPATGGYVFYSGSATIPMGQAFFVQSVVSSANITPSETWKVTSNDNTAILRTSSSLNYFFDDFLLDLTSSSVSKPFFTQAYFTFANNYTTNYESGDCLSFAGTYTSTPRIVAYVNNKMLTRTAYPALNGLTTIPVKVVTGYTGLYTINPVNLNKLPSGACVTLFDIANNVSHNLRTGPYTVNIAANATTPQFELRITLVPTTLTSNFTNPQCKKVGNGILVAKGNTAGPWNYTWKDINNNTIITHNNVSTFDTLKNVAEGTYNVDVNTVGTCDNANTQFVLNATTPLPTALFTANTTTVSANSNIPVSFTNNSSNATNYLWSFGDGATANTANASHAYSNVGTFDVKLIATNGVCADSSIAHSQITALANAVGISNNVLSSNNAYVGKDEKGVFINLDFDAVTKAEVTVTNILGQVIISKKVVMADKAKYYLNIPENEKIVFVTLVADNKKQTTKILN